MRILRRLGGLCRSVWVVIKEMLALMWHDVLELWDSIFRMPIEWRAWRSHWHQFSELMREQVTELDAENSQLISFAIVTRVILRASLISPVWAREWLSFLSVVDEELLGEQIRHNLDGERARTLSNASARKEWTTFWMEYAGELSGEERAFGCSLAVLAAAVGDRNWAQDWAGTLHDDSSRSVARKTIQALPRPSKWEIHDMHRRRERRTKRHLRSNLGRPLVTPTGTDSD